MSAMIGALAVAVPARDEAAGIEACVAALDRAAASVSQPVVLVVAADRCTDATAEVAERSMSRCHSIAASVVTVDCGTAGGARQAAATAAVGLATAGHLPLERIWLATTDADSAVDDDWFERQLAWAEAGYDGVAGLVRLDPTTDPHTSGRYERYVRDLGSGQGHRHIHGANLGVAAHWWERVGGFPPVASGEDHAIWVRLQNAGAHLLGVTDLGVTTSSRRHGRAPNGLAHLLTAISTATDGTTLALS
jgi:cellulose synthase/poly-beta-1,6-N-acetylglucosamine synthase-like glycosyltransferase